MQTDLPFFYKYNNLPSLADTGPTALFTLCIFCSVTNRSPVSLPETVSYQLIQQRLAITSSMETYLETSFVPLDDLKKFWILKKKKKRYPPNLTSSYIVVPLAENKVAIEDPCGGRESRFD